MWIVAKYKTKEFEILKKSFSKVLGEMPEFYIPKIKYTKYINNKLKVFNKNIFNNYIICKHHKFDDSKVINLLSNSRGLIYFLNGFKFNQKELEGFVNYCKSNEDLSGFLTQNFFDVTNKTKAKFISGPFTQMVFNIIEKQGNKLNILVNKLNITINKNSTHYLLYDYI